MLKTFISILLAVALCVCSVGCAATGSSTASVKNQVDSASVNGNVNDDSSKKEEYNKAKDVAIAIVIFVSAGLFSALTVGLAFKAANED